MICTSSSEDRQNKLIHVQGITTFRLEEREKIVNEMVLLLDFHCPKCGHEVKNAEFDIMGHSVGYRNNHPVLETCASYSCPECYETTNIDGSEDNAEFTCEWDRRD